MFGFFKKKTDTSELDEARRQLNLIEALGADRFARMKLMRDKSECIRRSEYHAMIWADVVDTNEKQDKIISLLEKITNQLERGQ